MTDCTLSFNLWAKGAIGEYYRSRRCTTGADSALASLPPVFRAVSATVIPEASDLDADGWAELEAAVALSLRGRPPALRRRLRLFLQVVDWAPILRYGRRFASLDPQLQNRVLAYLQGHPLGVVRMGFWGIRTLAFLGYYGRPEAAKRIGYHPDDRGWEARR